MNANMNYYELLGVKKSATKEEIKSAYKAQMKKWHPDINKDSNAVNMSSKINEAKEILLDDLKRKDYDEYLDKKVQENYNRYTQNKTYKNNNEDERNNNYEDVKVTKWQYLWQWMKYSNNSYFRKIIGFVGVLLESFICFIIKSLLIIAAYLCNMVSYFIRSIFAVIYPIFILLFALFVAQVIVNESFINTIKTMDKAVVNAIITIFVLFLSSIFLPLISNIILSPKIFDILYNKIDINLFKKCVGYKDLS